MIRLHNKNRESSSERWTDMKRMMLFLMMVVYIKPLFAQSKGDGALYYNDWVVGSGAIPDNACDVKSKDMGLTKLAGTDMFDATRMKVATVINDNYIGYKAQEYVAREINRYGAKFCKTVIGGYRKNCHYMSYTRYFEPEVQDCFWLCKDGYYGESCLSTALTSVTPQIPMEQFLIKKPNSGVGALAPFGTSGDNIEERIPMFRANEEIRCQGRVSSGGGMTDNWENLHSDNDEEHDMILAVESITDKDSKLQIKVQPLFLRAGNSQYCSGNQAAWNAWPMMKFVGDPIYVCPSDYKQEKGTDGTINCIDPEALSRQEKASVEALKADKLSHLCSSDGYQSSLFKDEIHNLVVIDKSTKNIKAEADQPQLGKEYDWNAKNACAIYKCKSEVLAFKSDWKTSGDMGCYDCTGDTGRFGIDKLGVCIKCDDGQIFVEGECKKADTLSKTDMLYGMGKTSSTSLADMCWTETNPTSYKCCVSNNQIPGATACQSNGGES
jgi:hypothetical protein